ncbi:MAG: response regulator [Myxococcota bacterium]
MSAPSILLIDDDRILRGRLAQAFERRGLEVFQAEDGGSGLDAAKANQPELVLLDLRMPGGDGLQLIPALLDVDGGTNIVVLTGYGSIATALEAVRLGATHYLTKPVDASEILAAFSRAEGQSYLAEGGREIETPTLARVEWEHIQRVLVDEGGNISRAAARLGMHRRSLQRKLAKHPVPR